jgi:hypothetical protein
MIPSDTGSLASERVSEARPMISGAAIGAWRSVSSTVAATAESTLSHHSFVGMTWPVLAWRARSSVVESTMANASSGSSVGNWSVTPRIDSVTRWPAIDAATSSPTNAPLWSRNVWPTTAGM